MAQQGLRGPKFTPKGSRSGQLMTVIADFEGKQVFVWNPKACRPTRERTVAELRKKRQGAV